MLVFLQQVINGLAQGGIYSLIAIGWTTVFGIVGVINWTHGEIYMLGAYTGYFVTTYLGLPLIPALLISMAAGALIAMAVDQFGYKPLRKKGVLAATGFITALGISTILRYTANAVFTVNPKAYPQLVDQKLITICTISGQPLTISSLHLYKSLAIKHGADMIVIDQLSLMSDKRRADIPRIAYNNISEDLFLMSKELKKPVLLMAQANREAVKNRKKGESPELHDLAESDGVGQNATRVLSLSVIDGTLKISVKKNRYGINNKEVLMIWEVNTGYLKPLLSENPEESTEDKKDDKPDGEQDKGGEKDYGF